jgi:hypothetical protein
MAAFVVAFVCLNAAGALCVAYCRSNESVAATPDHCPLKKAGTHCDRTADITDADAIKTSEIDCCPMTVSFFPAPLEKPSFNFEPATAALVVGRSDAPLTPVLSKFTVGVTESYRGPPLLDRRINRIKHRLLRI